MANLVGMPQIAEAIAKTSNKLQPLVDLPQQQGSSVGGDSRENAALDLYPERAASEKSKFS
jgi:hypothetical protein